MYKEGEMVSCKEVESMVRVLFACCFVGRIRDLIYKDILSCFIRCFSFG